MNTLSIRTIDRNAAGVFSGCYGAVIRQAQQAGCSRQTVYEHARQIERRLEPAVDFWELLQSDPVRLTQELSGPKDTP